MKYEILGGNLPVVICSLSAGESMITESGAMSWMTPGIEMQISSGGIGKAFGRMFSGESLFLNTFTAHRDGEIAFASSFPGAILKVDVAPGKSVICQKKSFLASESSVDLSIHFNQKMGAGFFGGEGFIMQKLSGNGTAFIEIDGSMVEYELADGEQMIVDTGYLAMMDDTVSIDIQTVKGVKNVMFGGEGLFNTVLTGPGKIVLQTHPLSKIAQSIVPFLPSK